MAIPTPHTLSVRQYVEGATDAHGNPVDDWADPVEWPVHGVAPGASEEPRKPNRDLSEVLWTVYAPANELAPGYRGQVSLPWEDVGGEPLWYDAEGVPDDWSKGPWLFPDAGVVVELRRAEG